MDERAVRIGQRLVLSFLCCSVLRYFGSPSSGPVRPFGNRDEAPASERARLQARQGVRAALLEGLKVADSETLEPVRADGHEAGEMLIRGNTVMMGYLKNPEATAKAFAGGWFHTGDVAVVHPDGYLQITDRSKDVIISGGENISSVEVEDVLHRHPGVLHAAVVAQPDDKWGEVPCAFIERKAADATLVEAEIIAMPRVASHIGMTNTQALNCLRVKAVTCNVFSAVEQQLTPARILDCNGHAIRSAVRSSRLGRWSRPTTQARGPVRA